MQGRLGKTTRHPVMKLMVDFNNVGFSNKDNWVDITDEILDISGSKEKSGRQIGSVSSDIATFTADNTSKQFSNDNPNSPFYKKIKSNLKFRLLTGFQGETLVPYASGYIESFSPSWLEKKVLIKTTDYFKLFRDADVPEESFQDISWDALVNVLCDHVGLPDFIVRHIPKTEFHYNYFKFEEENCFEALKGLMELAVGEAYFEQEEFFVKTKLALNYQLETTASHDITVDDLLNFEENVDSQTIINYLSISSQYKSIAPLEVVFETPDNIVKVENEQVIYKGNNYILIDRDRLPLINNDDNPISIKNITQGRTIYVLGHEPQTGRINIHPDSLANLRPNDILSISYSYQQLALLTGQTRKYTFVMNQEVDSLNALDIAVWDERGDQKRVYSETPDTPNSVSRQSMTFDSKTNTVTIVLKNNYPSPITISTMQLRGYPIKVIAPIEVFVKDLPSIEEFGKKEVSMQNNYINNIKLAEKIGQYIVDNNKKDRKRISIDIPGYPEFTLDDISKVTEESSGTNHKFTIDRIDYTFNADSGWNVKSSLLELDSKPWVYESFKGESWEKTNPGKPDEDFLKDINANMIKNGGAELYTGFADKEDILAVGQKHIIADYWTFTRERGNATARIRDGGNLVLHGLHSFEITTSNSGTGYYEQIVKGMKNSSTYVLSFVASLASCSGKASVLQYNDDVLLQTDSVTIDNQGSYELAISSLPNTNAAVLRIEKMAGTNGTESMVFDKVKFENSKQSTPYIENEETSAVQIGQRYANSVVIGNNYGIEVFDNLNRPRVRLGQYAPGEYGLQIIGGLSEDQIAADAVKKWNDATTLARSAKNSVDEFGTTLADLADDNKLTFTDRVYVKDKITSVVGFVQANTTPTLPTLATLDQNNVGEVSNVRKQAASVGLGSDALYTAVGTEYNNLKSYLEAMSPKPWDTGDANKSQSIIIVASTFRDKWLKYYQAIDALSNKVSIKLKEVADEAVKKGASYNGITIDAASGFKATRSNNTARTIMNATDGIKIQSSKDYGSSWQDVFYVDTQGNGNFSGYIKGSIIEGSEVRSSDKPDFMDNTFTNRAAFVAGHLELEARGLGATQAVRTVLNGFGMQMYGDSSFISTPSDYLSNNSSVSYGTYGIHAYAKSNKKSSFFLNATKFGVGDSLKQIFTFDSSGTNPKMGIASMFNTAEFNINSSLAFNANDWVFSISTPSKGNVMTFKGSTVEFGMPIDVPSAAINFGISYNSNGSVGNYDQIWFDDSENQYWFMADSSTNKNSTGSNLATLATGGVIANSISYNPYSASSAVRVYIKTKTITSDVRCVTADSNSTFVPITAKSFDTGSSVISKTNIKELSNEDANYILDNTPIFEYNLITDMEGMVYDKTIGAISQGVPRILQSDNGLSVRLYPMVSMNTKILQMHKKDIFDIKKYVSDLEEALEMTIQTTIEQDEKINDLESRLSRLESLI